jgi:hypothetical protein
MCRSNGLQTCPVYAECHISTQILADLRAFVLSISIWVQILWYDIKRDHNFFLSVIIIIQGYYKRNRQFQHFIKTKLFKISTLTMNGFVEKLWKFYHCSPWRRKQREVRNYLDANLPQRWIGWQHATHMLATPKSRSNTLWLLFMGICHRQGFVPPVPVTLDDLKQRITTATAGVDVNACLARIRPALWYMPCD